MKNNNLNNSSLFDFPLTYYRDKISIRFFFLKNKVLELFDLLFLFFFIKSFFSKRLFVKKGEVNEVVLVIILVIFMILLAIGYVIFKIKGIKEAVGLS